MMVRKAPEEVAFPNIEDWREPNAGNTGLECQVEMQEFEVTKEESPDMEWILYQQDQTCIMNVTKAADLNLDQSDLDETVFIREGATLEAESLEGDLAMIPEPSEEGGPATRDDLMIGDPNVNTTEEIERMKI